jgi:RHS repeat-associated protein
LNGGSTQYQYLYCGSNSTQPHQLTGLYSIGATCSTKTGQVYSSSDDAWGNVTSRTYSGTTATLTYDLLDHLIKWYVSSTNQEQYVYDANGERVLRRSTNSSGTTMTVYAFGLEEHSYTGSGTLLSSTYYYTLAGRLIGALDANGTTFYLTDALGSLLASFTNTANSASLKSNQLYGPYGNARYTSGTLNTAKGFTGQYNDSLTGLDYFNARYYDPVAGVFLSADQVQGDPQSMNPYAYVDGNPETFGDPTGKYMATIALISQQCGAVDYALPGTDILTTVISTGYVGSVTTLSGQ